MTMIPALQLSEDVHLSDSRRLLDIDRIGEFRAQNGTANPHFSDSRQATASHAAAIPL
jgi:hypothetical protein